MCISVSSVGNAAPRERGIKRLIAIARGVAGMFMLVMRVVVQGAIEWLADRFQPGQRT